MLKHNLLQKDIRGLQSSMDKLTNSLSAIFEKSTSSSHLVTTATSPPVASNIGTESLITSPNSEVDTPNSDIQMTPIRPINQATSSTLFSVPSEEFLSSSEINSILENSCSRSNFATKLSRRLFDEKTRLASNVSGRGKKQLDPKKISYIRSIVSKKYPVIPPQKETEQWAQCVIAIDEASRRLKNKPKKRLVTCSV